jgi:PAS domain S-box-containing protein
VGWFVTRSARAIGDFFDVAIAHSDPIESTRFEAARTNDWRPIETHLKSLAAANEDLDAFYATMVTRIVARFPTEPDRLTDALIVLGDYKAGALRRIARQHDERVLDAALDGVISIDEHGVITELNRSAIKIFGYTREQAIGRSLAELVIPQRMRAAHAAGLVRAAKGIFHVVGRRVELTAMRADGTEFPVELSLVPTRVAGKQMFTGFLRDLTEAKQAEASVAVWAHALDRAVFGVVISDLETGTIQRVNQTVVEMLRYSHDQLIGRNATEMVAPISKSSLPTLALEIGPHGSHSHEIWLRRGDGTDLLAWSTTAVVEVRANVRVRVSTLIDVTERHRLELAMRASTERLQIISSTSHEFASATGGVDDVLALVARRLGQILGEGCFTRLLSDDGQWLEPSTAFYHPDERVRESVRNVIGAQRQRVGEGLAGRVAEIGSPVMFSSTTAAVELPPPFRKLVEAAGITSALAVPLHVGGRLIGVVSLLRKTAYTIADQQLAVDLADRAALAIDNGMLVANLERRVRERTRELEDANRELETFSYTVAHDLRAPLRAINGFGSALAEYDQLFDEQGKHYLSRIRAATQRMANLIDDLLGLARIGRVTLSLAAVDVSAMCSEVVAELRQHEPDRDAIDIEPNLETCADPRLLRIVLENLVGNAWKFTSKISHAQIQVGRAPDGLFVRDNGAGFDMAYAGKLFAPFQRLHSADEFEGTGIGLATVHRIVRHHGGTIRAESAPGQGARFVFSLVGL